MADFEHVRALLRMAHKDFNALTGMMDSALFADEIFGFHVQQAIEKGLKAWLCACGIAYPPTHDLARLLTLLEKPERMLSNSGHWFSSPSLQFRHVTKMALPIGTNRWRGLLKSKMSAPCWRQQKNPSRKRRCNGTSVIHGA